MKTFSGFARFAGCLFTQRGVFCLALVLGVATFAAGCGKGKSTGPTAGATPPLQTNQDTNQPTAPGSAVNSQPVPAPPAPNVAVAPNTGPDLGQLQRALARWLVRNRRPPANFEDFAATAGVTIPPPPAGKKYFIVPRTMQIMLVNQ